LQARPSVAKQKQINKQQRWGRDEIEVVSGLRRPETWPAAWAIKKRNVLVYWQEGTKPQVVLLLVFGFVFFLPDINENCFSLEAHALGASGASVSDLGLRPSPPSHHPTSGCNPSKGMVAAIFGEKMRGGRRLSLTISLTNWASGP